MKIFINISSNKWTQKAKPETFSFCIYPVLTISKILEKFKKTKGYSITHTNHAISSV